MKTISGNCVSSKQITLSKAAKILSKFVSADNGASQVTNAYLHRASAAFDELNHLHKELELPYSHKKKKGHKTDKTHDVIGKVIENYVRSFETNRDLNHGYLQSKNEFSRQQLGSENVDEDGNKSTQLVVKLSKELNGSIGYDVGNDGNEKHKKNKKKQEIESRHDGNSVKREEEGEEKLSFNVQNESASGREHDNEGDGNKGMEVGKKQKKKKEEGDKSSVQNGTESGQEQGNEGDGNMGMEEGKKLKKDKKKKNKEGTGDMTKNRMKRKHEDDP